MGLVAAESGFDVTELWAGGSECSNLTFGVSELSRIVSELCAGVRPGVLAVRS